MFTSEKISNFLQSVQFAGTEEKPTLKCAFYITPLEYELCYEIDDRVAKQLFRREGGNHMPVAELDDVTLKIGELGAHNIEWYSHPEADGSGVLTAAAMITKVEASKLFSDKPDWSLIWYVQIPLDSNSIELVRKYYKKTVFLTLEKSQDELFETDDTKPIVLDDATVESKELISCMVCNTQAEYLDSAGEGWCSKDLRAAVGVQVRRLKYVS